MFSSLNICENEIKSKSTRRSKILALAIISLIISGCGSENKPLSNPSDKPNNSILPQIQEKLPDRYNLGISASSDLIAGWNVDIRPDGLGLPKGFGSVDAGETLYEEKCALCHGSFGEGVDQWPKLTGGEGSLKDSRPLKSIGSYWPYATTLWDYINKAMPFPAPQSLETNEVYAITAYILNLNDLVEQDFVLNQGNLPLIEMPNKNGFYADNRPDTTNTRCMQNCKKASDITIRPGPRYVLEVSRINNHETISNKDKHDDGKRIYEQACFVCHTGGIAGAPKLALNSDWTQRINKNIESVYSNALNGLNSMPAKGGRLDLSDDQIKSAVDYMISTLK